MGKTRSCGEARTGKTGRERLSGILSELSYDISLAVRVCDSEESGVRRDCGVSWVSGIEKEMVAGGGDVGELGLLVYAVCSKLVSSSSPSGVVSTVRYATKLDYRMRSKSQS